MSDNTSKVAKVFKCLWALVKFLVTFKKQQEGNSNE